MTAHESVSGMIGNTPLVRVRHLDTGICDLYLKMECLNPGGSIKDRIASAMVEAAEKDGRLKPGGTIVEATAGNTGISLATVAANKGYKTLCVVPDKMSTEKLDHLRALGAQIVVTRSDVCKGHPDYYQDMAERLAGEIPHAFRCDQFANPANPMAHETTTAPEIFAQMDGNLDAVVCGVGSGGTLTGCGRFFRAKGLSVDMILADPEGSVLAPYVRSGEMAAAGSWLAEGVGEDFIPPNCDLSLVTKAYSVSDSDGIAAAYDLVRHEGILAGSSSGILLAAALRYCREQQTPKRVVTFVCDGGTKYLSKMYNPEWLARNGIVLSSA